MKAKFANRASVRTKQQIQQAFTQLLMEKKQLNKVTVTAISRLCDMDRSTFYAYYDDVYAIAEELEAKTAEALFREPAASDEDTDIALCLEHCLFPSGSEQGEISSASRVRRAHALYGIAQKTHL